MKIWQFLNNIKDGTNFLEQLEKIQCPVVENIINNLNNGYDLFHCINMHTDQLGKFLLVSRSVTALKYLGKYHIIKQKIKDMFNSMILYPLTISIMILMIFCYMYYSGIFDLLFLSNWLIANITCTIVVIVGYRYIKSYLKKQIMLILLLCFLTKNLSFNNMVLTLNAMGFATNNMDDFQSIFLKISGYNFITLENLEHSIEDNWDEVIDKCKKGLFWIKIVLLSLLGILICILLNKTSYAIINKFITLK